MEKLAKTVKSKQKIGADKLDLQRQNGTPTKTNDLTNIVSLGTIILNTHYFKNDSESKKRALFSKVKRRILKHVWLVRLAIVFALLIAVGALIYALGYMIMKSSFGRYVDLARNFVFTPREEVNIIDGKVNILILGKGGVGHEAPDLTDTLIFASIDFDNPKVDLVSLPRDYWIPELRAKLNSAYFWGNKKQPPVQLSAQRALQLGERTSGPADQGGGLILAKSTVEKVIGQTIQYAVVIDFEAFKKIIDILEGVEVDVETAFSDEKFPIAGLENDLCGGDPEYKCRYEVVKFAKGKQMLDGETALKFVRSRNAVGDEGTDFARSLRQQKVIAAVKDKLLSKEVILRPTKLLAVKEELMKNSETDITPSEAAVLARKIWQGRDNVVSHSFPENLLVNPPKSVKYDNLYVFIPKDQTGDEIRKWVNDTIQQ